MAQDFEALVEAHHNLVMSLIRRYYGGRFQEEAEDLAQEIWTKLWVVFQKNENNIVNFKSYLYRTVQTTLWDAARALDKGVVEADSDQTEAWGEPPAEIEQVRRLDLERLLSKLKDEEARMVRAYIKGFTNEEIAVLTGTSEGRVRNLLSRIKKKLAQLGGA